MAAGRSLRSLDAAFPQDGRRRKRKGPGCTSLLWISGRAKGSIVDWMQLLRNLPREAGGGGGSPDRVRDLRGYTPSYPGRVSDQVLANAPEKSSFRTKNSPSSSHKKPKEKMINMLVSSLSTDFQNRSPAPLQALRLFPSPVL